ncbi:MAG: cation transporter [Nitrospirae bacterium]|nr:cation transporter [Nitrospirota bacterium]
MKNTIHRILISVFILSCFLFTISNAGSAEGNLKQVTLKVEGMTCATCPVTVKVALKRLPGVINTDVSFKEAKAVVGYQEGKVTVEQMIKAIEDAGYYADLITGEKR